MLLYSPLELHLFESSLIGALSLLHQPPLKEEFQCSYILRTRGFTSPTLPYRNSNQGTNSQEEKKSTISCLVHPFEVQTLFHSHAFFNYLQQYTKLYTSSHHCAFGYFPTDAIGGMDLSPIKYHYPLPPNSGRCSNFCKKYYSSRDSIVLFLHCR